YIGNAVAKELTHAGPVVTGLVRSPEKAKALEEIGAKAVVGDIKDPKSYREAAAGCEVMVHTAFEYSEKGVEADRTVVTTFLEVARAHEGVRQIVYTSGIWVLGQTDGEGPVFEDAPTDHPAALVAWRVGHEKKILGAAADRLATAVVRPGMVYGHQSGLIASYFESAEKEGAARYIGHGFNRVPFIHVDDLARFYRAVIEHHRRGVFHAVDGAAVQLVDAARAASEAAGKGGATRSVPLEEARAKMGPIADCLVLDQFIESSRNLEITWAPEVPSFLAGAERAYEELKKTRG
ncbi:MAG TPA: NAD-dependent epimerase/dehydratase family protein, partial [Thermoanaerobaculia bacterium]|nr:NAD-dependent epimerase/dehydratase family protein [Thermoanaerobaculia bacterium]